MHPFADVVVVILAAAGAGCDLRTHRIPNLVTATGMVAGALLGWSALGLEGASRAALGCATGLALLGAPFALGVVGAGDVKFLMAFGALLGPAGTLTAFLWATAGGGLLALVVLGLTSRGRKRVLTSWIQFKNFVYTRDVSVLKPSQGRDTIAVPYGLALAFGGLMAQFGRGMVVG